jgi:hypothetical protein
MRDKPEKAIDSCDINPRFKWQLVLAHFEIERLYLIVG